ncbi:MAG: hypothetical protein EOO38_30445 [Cytophagaceae bacterium]|nr:MAG: hypothetical protein EOO38_30445 [Cytophagaceae bacterium]
MAPSEADAFLKHFRQETTTLYQEIEQYQGSRSLIADRHRREQADLQAQHTAELAQLDAQATALTTKCRALQVCCPSQTTLCPDINS